MQLEQPEVFAYSMAFSNDGWWTFWEYQKRSSLYYNFNGTPKEKPVIPDGAVIDPTTDEDRKSITDHCIKDKLTRVSLNKLDIHRIPPKGLAGMMAYALKELR